MSTDITDIIQKNAGAASAVTAKTTDTQETQTEELIFNGEIEDTQQGNTGDCWLLSGINALSYTEEGRNIIEEALEYEEEGTTVNLQGIGEYYISNDEVIQAKEEGNYSTGDDDMILFELAYEQAREDYYNDDIYFADEASNTLIPNNSDLNSGLLSQTFYYLTGKQTESATSKERKSELLEKFIEDGGENYALAAGSNIEETTVRDVDGNSIYISSTHAFAVKSADDETVTITNPWDSSEEIVLSKDTFLNTFEVVGIDLSEENEEVDLAGQTTKETVEEDGNTIENVSDENGELLKQRIYDSQGNMISQINYSRGTKDTEEIYENSILTQINTYNSSEEICRTDTYDEDGNLKKMTSYYSYSDKQVRSEYVYNNDGTCVNTFYDEEGNVSMVENYVQDEKVSRVTYNEDGDIKTLTFTSGSTTKNQTNEYYKNGNIKSSEITIKDTESGEVKTTANQEYYKNGNIKSDVTTTVNDDSTQSKVTSSYRKDGSLKKEVECSYDEDGNLISKETKYYNENGEITKTKTN